MKAGIETSEHHAMQLLLERLLSAFLLVLCVVKDESYWQNQFVGKRFMTTYVFLILHHYFRFGIKGKTVSILGKYHCMFTLFWY